VEYATGRSKTTWTSAAQVKITLPGLTSAAPCPHTSTAGVAAVVVVAAVGIAPADVDSARLLVSAARAVSAPMRQLR